MDFSVSQGYVLLVVIFLIASLYREWFNPSLTFFISTVALLLGGVITPKELLTGLANEQIILVFLLVVVTASIRAVYGPELFTRFFHPKLSPKKFLFRMMAFVSSISAFLNNTPIVAFMIPYVRDWAQRSGYPASKFLIPLSFATILGGMITVIGTSTNLVLNGLIAQYNLPLLGFYDFVFLGLLVTVFGGAYLYFIGYRLLPDNPNEIDVLREHVREYIVETEVSPESKLIGKTVKEAGLRKLKDVFLVEIIRREKVISPVSPNERLESGDALFFSGNTASIFELIRRDNGITVPKETEESEHFNFTEAVIPANSELVGRRIMDSDFRKKYHASIIAIHRNGKRISGRVGEMYLAGGDFLLLLSDRNGNGQSNPNDLYYLSVPKKITDEENRFSGILGLVSLLLLIAGVVNLIPIFHACLVILVLTVSFGILKLTEIRRELDLSLLMILVCSLAVGVALEKSGTADMIAKGLITSGQSLGAIAVLSMLFVVTLVLTALITNAAAVSIVFPIAMSVAEQMQLDYRPFFVGIAFAASGDFMTPIGYQTNLMVYGPGGYTFKDFFKVGGPLTLLYTLICITFIYFYYNL